MTEVGKVEAGVAAARRWPRWMGVALTLSLALNLLILGAMATAAWRHRLWHEPAGRGVNVFGFMRTLEPERRRAVMEVARNERRELMPYRADLGRARDAVRVALQKQPFDAAAYRQAHDSLLAAEIAARTAAHKFFDAVVEKLDNGERAALARWLARADRPWRHHGGPGGRGRDDDAAITDAPVDQPAAAKK